MATTSRAARIDAATKKTTSRNGKVPTASRGAVKAAPKRAAPRGAKASAKELNLAPVIDRQRSKVEISSLTDEATGYIDVTLISTAPMIQHRMSQKARRAILDKQMGVACGKKAPRDPEQDFLNGLHYTGKPITKQSQVAKRTKDMGFPAVALKAAMVEAAMRYHGWTKVDARAALFIGGQAPSQDGDGLVLFTKCAAPELHESTVRIQTTTSVALRPMFETWEARVRIEYQGRLVTWKQAMQWLIDAGKFIGLGEWRILGKQSAGSFGSFGVESAEVDEPLFS